MEYRDVYDFSGQKTGKVISREQKLGPGEFCRTVCICVFSTKGELLIQQRQTDKELWPGLWDITAAGGVLAGESAQEAAERELWEEMGIDADFTGVRPHLTTYFSSGFSDVFTLERDIPLESLTLQKEEVQAARWATLEEILRMMDEETFIPYFRSYVQVLFDYRKQYGSFRL